MTDHRDQIDQIIQEAERKAFERGFRAASSLLVEYIGVSLQSLFPKDTGNADDTPLAPSVPPPPRGRPKGKAINIVADCITSAPGMKGVDVVKAAQEIDPSIKERTVRTCLRRLRLAKVIWRRTGQWYPKAHERTGTEHGIGEALGSPPL